MRRALTACKPRTNHAEWLVLADHPHGLRRAFIQTHQLNNPNYQVIRVEVFFNFLNLYHDGPNLKLLPIELKLRQKLFRKLS